MTQAQVATSGRRHERVTRGVVAATLMTGSTPAVSILERHVPMSWTRFDRFVDRAMAGADVEALDDGETYASIPQCPGVWATAGSPVEALDELRGVLVGWLLLKIGDGDTDIPVIDGITPVRA